MDEGAAVRTIAIINQKGGCGKTTTAINLAGILAREGLRTLLVDMDPQSHCAAGLAIPEQRIDLDIGDAMLAEPTEPLDATRLVWRASRNLDLIPSRMKLAGLEASRGGLAEKPDKERRLAGVLTRFDRNYDACLVDCSPAIGLLTFNALAAATVVLIPVETSFFSLQGATKQVNTIRTLSKRLSSPAPYWIVPTIHDETSALARDLLDELHRRFGKRVAPAVIRRDLTLKEAASFGQPVIEYSPSSAGAADYTLLAQWLISTAGLGGGSRPRMPEPIAVEPDDGPIHEETPIGGVTVLPHVEVIGPRDSGTGNGKRATGGGAEAAAPRAQSASAESKPEVVRGLKEPAAPPKLVMEDGAIAASDRSSTAVAEYEPAWESGPRPGVASAPDVPEAPVSEPPVVVTTAAATLLSRAEDLAQRARRLLLKRDSESAAPAGEAPRSASPQIISEPAVMRPVGGAIDERLTEEAASRARQESIRRLFGARATRRGVLFVQPLTSGFRVSIAGDFNGWSATANVMRRNEDLGVYEACVPVPPGRRQYRLVIDGRWTADPYNAETEPNPFGEANSVVTIEPGEIEAAP